MHMLYHSVVFVLFNPMEYNVFEDTGQVTVAIEKIGANEIPVNVSVMTQDVNATGKAEDRCTLCTKTIIFRQEKSSTVSMYPMNFTTYPFIFLHFLPRRQSNLCDCRKPKVFCSINI